MPVVLANPKQSVTLDQARIMRIVIENNPCKHGPGANHKYIDLYVVWGRENGGQFEEFMDPNTSAIAQYYRVSDGMNPYARPALPGMDPASDGPPLGRCDHPDCLAWHDKLIGSKCDELGSCADLPEESRGTIQPYDGWSRSGAAVLPGLQDLVKDAMGAFSGTDGAQAAFAAGGAVLDQALDDFMSSPTFLGMVYSPDHGFYVYKTISKIMYNFLITEMIPDPNTGNITALLETA